MTNVQSKQSRFWSLGLGHLLVILIWSLGIAQTTGPAIQFDFQNTPAVPSDFKILSGEFSIKEENSNQFLELSPWPLNSLGLLLGPEQADLATLQARIRGSSTGRRFPEFGIGLGGIGGYRLWLMPAIDQLQIKQGDKVLATIPFIWKSGNWTNLKISVSKSAEARWLVTGKAWNEGDSEPAEWTIRFEAGEAPPTGRASLWGTPYSETPIQFDDVRIEAR